MLLHILRRIKCTNTRYSQKYSIFLMNNRKYSSRNNKTDPKYMAIDGTMENVKEKLIQKTGVGRGYKPLGEHRTHLLKYLPAKQEELPARTMNDSFASAMIPLSTDEELRDKYIGFLGNVRIGRLLEDMDLFAAYVAHKHILNPKQPEGVPSPYVLVTALVDRIDFTDFRAKPNEDIRLSGHVSWVGKSSVEVVVWLEQISNGSLRRLTRALFLMAARDTTVEKSAVVNRLVGTTNEEKQILAAGEIRKKNRMVIQNTHLLRVIPNADEQNIIHKMFVRTVDLRESSLKKRYLPEGCVWMETCTLSNLIFSHPENRNLQNTVFGGFIMRNALEISWALGFLFSKYHPTIISISDISFNQPIQVSTLIRMFAHIAYTQKHFFQITVHAEALNPPSGTTITTNIFHFTYETPDNLPEVFPHSYQEAMMYIDGRRHFVNVMSPKKLKDTEK